MKKILLLLSLLSQTVYSQKTLKMAPSGDWKTDENETFFIQYPANWELRDARKVGADFMVFSPLESEKDKFRENINLITQDLKGMNIDLSKYTEISENQIKTLATNSVLLESKRIQNKGVEFQRVIYTADQGIYHLQFIQYYWVLNEKAYVLTFTAEQSRFEFFKETAQKIMNSFELK